MELVKKIQHHHGNLQVPVDHNKTKSLSAAEYTCPMHPQVRKTEPGNCPICGMTLEPVMDR